MADTEQQEIVERFGRFDDKIRVLLCSDVASEGSQPALLLPSPGAL
jgi:superfamily II DNA/RNA helicase